MNDGEMSEQDFEFYDEPIDNSVYGWEDCDIPCPECGGQMWERVTQILGLEMTERVCQSCEFSSEHYDG